MQRQFARTEILLGRDAMEVLKNSHVAVFGIGGVGGYTAEALARSGVGSIDLIDNDTVSITNLNRQIIATHKTIGQYKVDIMRERLLEINPDLNISTYKCFYLPNVKSQFDFSKYSYIVDAVDTVTAKITLVLEAQKSGTPIISSMGAGNKINPAAFEVADIYQTSVCPLAKVMRRELKRYDVKHLKVVYSKEKPLAPAVETQEGKEVSVVFDKCIEQTQKRQIPGSVAFVPSVAGLIMAGEVVKDLTKQYLL